MVCIAFGWYLHPDKEIVVKNCELPEVVTTNRAASNLILPNSPEENHYTNITINVYIDNDPTEDNYVFCELYPYDSSCVQDIPDDLHEAISEDDGIVIRKKPNQTISQKEYEDGYHRLPSAVMPEHNEGIKAPEVDTPSYDSDADITMSVKKGN